MKNPAGYIRKAITAALSSLTYNGSPVPVYENEAVSGIPYQVTIADYSDSDASNKDYFGADAQQVVEVVAFQSTSARKYVDEIGDLVMNALKPTIKSEGLADSVEWQVFVLGRPSINHLTEDTGSGYVVRLIMRFNILIIQKTNN